MSLLRTVLAIADNARHPCNNAVPEAAVFNSKEEIAEVTRAELKGLMTRRSTARGEIWSAITPAGQAKLSWLRGDS